jgi:ABC-type sugar transport system ATPase subunit
MTYDEDQQLALRVSNLSKSYPGVQALKGVSFNLCAGEVHALVGQNGAGKSTLMKAISGAVKPDSGSVMVWGSDLAGGHPRKAFDAGLAIIYQELAIVPDLTALANVFLGKLPRKFGFIDRRKALEKFLEVAQIVGFHHPALERAGDLSTANQQLLEIMRSLVSGKRLIIMDEPTASLGPEDIARLHSLIRSLKAQGYAVVYVSHDLDAVLDISDTVTVLVEGTVVDSRTAAEWSKPTLIRSMLGGRDLAKRVAPSLTVNRDKPLFTAKGLRAPGVQVDELAVCAGEIIGLAGLVGSGRTRLLRALAGANPVDKGIFERMGQTEEWPRSVRGAIRKGFGLAPEDRKSQGLVFGQSSAWNVALGQFSQAVGVIVTNAKLTSAVKAFTTSVGFNPSRLGASASTLSGGNQQKLVLARWMYRRASCLLLDEPTRGIDIGAKAQIFETVRKLAAGGGAVIWASSDLDEIVQYSTRILVIEGGRIVAELPAGSTVHDILEVSFAARIPDREKTA